MTGKSQQIRARVAELLAGWGPAAPEDRDALGHEAEQVAQAEYRGED